MMKVTCNLYLSFQGFDRLYKVKLLINDNEKDCFIKILEKILKLKGIEVGSVVVPFSCTSEADYKQILRYLIEIKSLPEELYTLYKINKESFKIYMDNVVFKDFEKVK